MENKTLITSVNPSFFLKKLNYNNLINDYNSGKFNNIKPVLLYNKDIETNIVKLNKVIEKPIGFQVLLGNTLVVIKGKSNRYGICANCRADYTGFCGIGIPYKFSKYDQNDTYMDSDSKSIKNVLQFETEGETCSIECSFSYYKKNGGSKLIMNTRFMDSEQMLIMILFLLFNKTELKEAPDTTLLIPYGNTSITEYRKNLHMYSEYKELQNIEISNNSNSKKVNIRI